MHEGQQPRDLRENGTRSSSPQLRQQVRTKPSSKSPQQEQRRGAVLRALLPIALGHALSIGAVVLTAWSFLMATAHGAGLMLAPVLFGWGGGSGEAHAHHAGQAQHMAGGHAEHGAALAAAASTPLLGLAATAIHTLGYLLVMGAIALVVYEKVGLAILRKAWFNLDVVWAIALMITGVVTLAL